MDKKSPDLTGLGGRISPQFRWFSTGGGCSKKQGCDEAVQTMVLGGVALRRKTGCLSRVERPATLDEVGKPTGRFFRECSPARRKRQNKHGASISTLGQADLWGPLRGASVPPGNLGFPCPLASVSPSGMLGSSESDSKKPVAMRSGLRIPKVDRPHFLRRGAGATQPTVRAD